MTHLGVDVDACRLRRSGWCRRRAGCRGDAAGPGAVQSRPAAARLRRTVRSSHPGRTPGEPDSGCLPASTWVTSSTTRARSAPRVARTWAATPSPSRTRPSSRCSVPMQSWPSRFGLLAASSRTFLLRGVKELLPHACGRPGQGTGPGRRGPAGPRPAWPPPQRRDPAGSTGRGPAPPAARTVPPSDGSGGAAVVAELTPVIGRKPLLSCPDREGVPLRFIPVVEGVAGAVVEARPYVLAGLAPNCRSCPMISMPLILCPYCSRSTCWMRKKPPSIHS